MKIALARAHNLMNLHLGEVMVKRRSGSTMTANTLYSQCVSVSLGDRDIVTKASAILNIEIIQFSLSTCKLHPKATIESYQEATVSSSCKILCCVY